MKNRYISPAMFILSLNQEDIIATSVAQPWADDVQEWGLNRIPKE